MNYKNQCPLLKFRPLIISKIYVFFKIHTENELIRPIISATNSMGIPLSKWILFKLKSMARHLNHYQISSAQELINKIEGKHLNNENHILIAWEWDYNNMLTNIPFG